MKSLLNEPVNFFDTKKEESFLEKDSSKKQSKIYKRKFFEEEESEEEIESFDYKTLQTLKSREDEKEAEEEKEGNASTKLDNEEILKEKEKILEEAKIQARKIIEEAKKESIKICEDAKTVGYEEMVILGEKAIRDEKQKLHKKFDENIQEAFEDITLLKERLAKKYLNELKDISVAVAEKVIGVALESSGEIVKNLIMEEVEKKHTLNFLKIYIDGDSYSSLVEADQDITDALTAVADNVKFIVLDNHPKGHCIIETPNEIIDLSVDTQMKNLKERLDSIRM